MWVRREMLVSYRLICFQSAQELGGTGFCIHPSNHPHTYTPTYSQTACASGSARLGKDLHRPMSWRALIGVMLGLMMCPVVAADLSVDHRYYRDAAGHPKFLVGYYGWAAVPDGFFIDHPSRYAAMMQ